MRTLRTFIDDDYRARLDEKSCPEPNTGCVLWTGSVNNKGYDMKQYAVILTISCLSTFGCSDSSQPTENTGQTEQASSIAGWSGFMGYGTACLAATSATLGAILTTAACSTSSSLENFSLNTSAQLHASGVSATAFTQHQGLCLKNTSGGGCSGLCVGYSQSYATLVSCTSSSELVNDLGYGWGAIYTNNGGTRCLNNAMDGSGHLDWGTCQQDSGTSWENMGFTCLFNASTGTPQSQYLESDFGSLGLSLFTQPYGSTVIDGVPQPNNAQEFCTRPVLNTFAYNVSAIEEGACSRNTGMWLTPTNPTSPTTDYTFVSTGSPTSYFTDRDTLAPGVIDSVLETLQGLEFAENPQTTGRLETGMQNTETAASGVEPRCVSGL